MLQQMLVSGKMDFSDKESASREDETCHSCSDESDDSEDCTGPFTPLNIKMEENLTLTRGFDDFSYIFLKSCSTSEEEIPNLRAKKSVKSKKRERRQKKTPTSIVNLPFKCKICSLEACSGYKVLSGLVKHLAKKHNLCYNLEREQKCWLCNKRTYKTRSALLKHVAKCHSLVFADFKELMDKQMCMEVDQLMLSTMVTASSPLIDQEDYFESLPAVNDILNYPPPSAETSDFELMNYQQSFMFGPNSIAMENQMHEELGTGWLPSFAQENFFSQPCSMLIEDKGVGSDTDFFWPESSLSSEEMETTNEIEKLVASLALNGTTLEMSVNEKEQQVVVDKKSSEMDRVDISIIDAESAGEKRMVLRPRKSLKIEVEIKTEEVDTEKGWCNFCERTYNMSQVHLKERMCTRCRFTSMCASQHSSHLLQHN